MKDKKKTQKHYFMGIRIDRIECRAWFNNFPLIMVVKFSNKDIKIHMTLITWLHFYLFTCVERKKNTFPTLKKTSIIYIHLNSIQFEDLRY